MGSIMHGGINYTGGGISPSEKGAPNGVATLNENGLVPSSQLPSYVDDVLEYASVSAFPATGETGKIYVALDTNLTYRWSGSAYVEISPSLALGETSSTAYRGDRGKTAYDHATESGRSGAKSAGLYKIGVTAQGHVASANAVAKADLTALGLADQNDVDAIEEDIEGYKTVTGKYITITDGAELPAKAYSLTLSPVQEGSGDPSPSNVRPIHGADEVGVRVCGVNLWDEDWELGAMNGTTGGNYPTNNSIRSKNYIHVKPGATYYGKIPTAYFNVYQYGKDKSYLGQSLVIASVANREFTVNENAYYIRLEINSGYGATYNNDISINYPSTDHDYHPYNGHSTTITLPSTVYGGSVEQDGSGSVTMANIASYNGETINEPWISSMDKYEAGATPTTGAQVVYPLTTPTALSVTPFPQTLLEGVNNVWAEMKENSVVIDNAQQSLSYQPQNIVGQLRQEINAKPDSFAQLSDTSFSNLANGQIPKWNSTSGKWENANESGGGGASSLADLSDTNISSPADGQILKWDGTTSKWVNANEYSYTLPTADANTLGGIKVGSRLSIDANGVLSANDQSYTLPTASASTKGGVKVGDNLSMNGEVLSAKTVPWTKIWNYRSGTSSATIPSGTTEIMLAIVYTYDTRDYAGSAIYPFNSGHNYGLEYYESYSSKWMYASIQGSGNSPSFIYGGGGSIPSYYDFEIWVR